MIFVVLLHFVYILRMRWGGIIIKFPFGGSDGEYSSSIPRTITWWQRWDISDELCPHIVPLHRPVQLASVHAMLVGLAGLSLGPLPQRLSDVIVFLCMPVWHQIVQLHAFSAWFPGPYRILEGCPSSICLPGFNPS